MKARPTILLVDLSNQLWRMSHVFSKLSHDGEFTGALYGVVRCVAQAMLHVRATRLVLCLDRRPYLRSIAYPDYKQLSRKDVDEELRAKVQVGMGQVLKLAAAVGIPTWGVPGFESDDLVAHVVAAERNRYDLVVAMSNDSDLGQLFWHPRFRLYRKMDKNTEQPIITTPDDFAKEWDLEPRDEYVRALAYSGTHNDLAGVHGIGPKKSADAVRSPAKWAAAMCVHGDIIRRNIPLIQLPHPELPKDLPVPRNTRINRNELIRFLGHYAIKPDSVIIDGMDMVGT